MKARKKPETHDVVTLLFMCAVVAAGALVLWATGGERRSFSIEGITITFPERWITRQEGEGASLFSARDSSSASPFELLLGTGAAGAIDDPFAAAGDAAVSHAKEHALFRMTDIGFVDLYGEQVLRMEYEFVDLGQGPLKVRDAVDFFLPDREGWLVLSLRSDRIAPTDGMGGSEVIRQALDDMLIEWHGGKR